jgi:hypothetical protein
MSLCRYHQCEHARPHCEAAALLITRAPARTSTFTSNVCRNGDYHLVPTTHFGVALNAAFITASLGPRRMVWGPTQAGAIALVRRSTARSYRLPSRCRLLVIFHLCPFGHVVVICHKLLPRLDRGTVHVRDDILFCLPDRRRARFGPGSYSNSP